VSSSSSISELNSTFAQLQTGNLAKLGLEKDVNRSMTDGLLSKVKSDQTLLANQENVQALQEAISLLGYDGQKQVQEALSTRVAAELQREGTDVNSILAVAKEWHVPTSPKLKEAIFERLQSELRKAEPDVALIDTLGGAAQRYESNSGLNAYRLFRQEGLKYDGAINRVLSDRDLSRFGEALRVRDELEMTNQPGAIDIRRVDQFLNRLGLTRDGKGSHQEIKWKDGRALTNETNHGMSIVYQNAPVKRNYLTNVAEAVMANVIRGN